MIDFKEEINKYKPVLALEDVEKAIHKDEMKDVMDLLQHIADQMILKSKE